MIEIVISNNFCSNCERQQAIMQNSFLKSEYTIIKEGSSAFESLDLKNQIVEFPYVIVRDNTGIKFLSKGVMDGTSLREALKNETKSFLFWKTSSNQASLAAS